MVHFSTPSTGVAQPMQQTEPWSCPVSMAGVVLAGDEVLMVSWLVHIRNQGAGWRVGDAMIYLFLQNLNLKRRACTNKLIIDNTVNLHCVVSDSVGVAAWWVRVGNACQSCNNWLGVVVWHCLGDLLRKLPKFGKVLRSQHTVQAAAGSLFKCCR